MLTSWLRKLYRFANLHRLCHLHHRLLTISITILIKENTKRLRVDNCKWNRMTSWQQLFSSYCWWIFGFNNNNKITTERKIWNNNIILNLSNNLFYFHLLFWSWRLPWKFSLLGLGITFRFRKFSLSLLVSEYAKI